MKPRLGRFKRELLLGNVFCESITTTAEEKQEEDQEASVRPRHVPLNPSHWRSEKSSITDWEPSVSSASLQTALVPHHEAHREPNPR